MKVMFYTPPTSFMQGWFEDIARALPEAECRFWQEGDTAHADYAVVWHPPASMLQGRTALKGIFNLGAGVDAILKLGDALPSGVPLVRVDDGGMAIQMAEYVTHAVLGYFRRFDAYRQQSARCEWQPLAPNTKQGFRVGILGLGVLGVRIASALAYFEFPVNGWSRSQKSLPGVDCYAGEDGLDAFLRASRVVVCILPLTPDTAGILNRDNLLKLDRGNGGAYVINVARGGHLVEDDLLALIGTGEIAGATLDVFGREPMDGGHPFWQESRICITPHISAVSVYEETIRQISGKIRVVEGGGVVGGVVDRAVGY